MADDGADMFEDLPEDEGVLLDLPGEAPAVWSQDDRGISGVAGIGKRLHSTQ